MASLRYRDLSSLSQHQVRIRGLSCRRRHCHEGVTHSVRSAIQEYRASKFEFEASTLQPLVEDSQNERPWADSARLQANPAWASYPAVYYTAKRLNDARHAAES